MTGRRRGNPAETVHDWAQQLQQARAAAQANAAGQRHPVPDSHDTPDAEFYEQLRTHMETDRVFAQTENRADAMRAQAGENFYTPRNRLVDILTQRRRAARRFTYGQFQDLINEHTDETEQPQIAITQTQFDQLREDLDAIIDPPDIREVDDDLYGLEGAFITVIEDPIELEPERIIIDDPLTDPEPLPGEENEDERFGYQWLRNNIDWQRQRFDYDTQVGITADLRLRHAIRCHRNEFTPQQEEIMKDQLTRYFHQLLHPRQEQRIYNIDNDLRDFIFFLHKHIDTRYRDEADDMFEQHKDSIWPAS